MFSIDYRSPVPLYLQIIDNVERLAARGVLQPDSQLPSVRGLAVELSLNPNTVSRAYGELEARGLIYSLPGRGNFLAASSSALLQAMEQQTLRRLHTLCSEYICLGQPRERWLTLCKEAWQQAENHENGKEEGEKHDRDTGADQTL